jgi:hypothetical protein
MLSDETIIDISTDYFKNVISKKLQLKIKSIHTIMLIGSCVQPLTMRKKSDIDLVFFLDDDYFDSPKNFKALYQTNVVKHNKKEINLAVDIKLYSLSSFQQEMYHDSLTRVFAILNAYKIIYSENSFVQDTLMDATERMDLSIQLGKEQLEKIDIVAEVENLENYFNDALSVLLSEKLKTNLALSYLRLYEYLKEFIVQYQRVLFAKDIQRNCNTKLMNEHIKNLLVFKNSDGTRLLDANKYVVDERVKILVANLHKALEKSGTISFDKLVNSLFGCINDAFKKDIGYSILNDKKRYAYFSYTTVKKMV